MFIVIEGLDGAGKSTQVAKIEQWLKQQGRQYEYLHFPRFTTPVYGELIAQFLRGELGAIDKVDPRLVALIYAGDRAQASSMIRGWLAQGKAVILDRYVYSNVAYQCAKSPDCNQLKEWIIDLEYNHNNIPRPDVSLFLDVPFLFTERSLTAARDGDDRDYLKGKTDIHEASLDFQRQVREIYLECATNDSKFKIVDCSDSNGGMLPAENIFKLIQHEIAPFIL